MLGKFSDIPGRIKPKKYNTFTLVIIYTDSRSKIITEQVMLLKYHSVPSRTARVHTVSTSGPSRIAVRNDTYFNNFFNSYYFSTYS